MSRCRMNDGSMAQPGRRSREDRREIMRETAAPDPREPVTPGAQGFSWSGRALRAVLAVGRSDACGAASVRVLARPRLESSSAVPPRLAASHRLLFPRSPLKSHKMRKNKFQKISRPSAPGRAPGDGGATTAMKAAARVGLVRSPPSPQGFDRPEGEGAPAVAK